MGCRVAFCYALDIGIREVIVKLSALAGSLFCLILMTADQGFGQAIVGYGINVGRAGAAGAGAGAAGAGAAGIFKKLGNRMEADSKSSGHRTARTAQPEFDPEDLEAKKPEREEPAFDNSGTMKTKSGVKISGLSARRASPTRVRYAARPYDYAPSAGSAETTTAAPSAAAAPQPATGAVSAQDAEADDSAAPEATATESAGSPSTESADVSPQEQPTSTASVLNARRDRAAPKGTDAVLTPEAQKFLEVDSEIADIAIGTPIEDLISRFGKPLFKMVGLGAQGYNEKYIFRAPDGRRFTVFAQDGAVADITIEPAEIASL